MTDLYAKQRRDRLTDVVADYLTDESVTPELFYQELREEIESWLTYYQDYHDKASSMLSYFQGSRSFNDWTHPDSGIERVKRSEQQKEREYNMREQAYIDKRARLDAISEATDKDWEDFWKGDAPEGEFDMMLSQYGYEYTPKIS